MAERPWKRLYFSPTAPAPDPGAHELVLRFDADGGIGFEASTDAPEALAGHVRLLLAIFAERPDLVAEASGIHGAAVEWPGGGPRFDGRGTFRPPIELRELDG
jgi:hypothetical protein